LRDSDKALELLAKDLQLGGVSRMPVEGFPNPIFTKYSNDELVQKNEEYWRIKGIRGYYPEEISSGKTREGFEIPFKSKGADGLGLMADRIRNSTLHFQSKEEFDKAIQEYKLNKTGDLEGIFKRFGLSGDSEQDSYIDQQALLLEYMR